MKATSLIQVLFLLQACGLKDEIDSNYYCQKLKLNCVQGNKIIQFKTTKGDFSVKLFGKDNPITVANFIDNIENNIYENKKFYKIINYPQLKIIYGGFNSKNKFYNERNETLDNKIPSIPLEIKFKQEIEPRYKYQIKNPSEAENLINTFESGSIAMVKIGNKNSSSTEFFFVTNKIPELDGRYSIFGKIIKGLDVLENIKKEDYIKEIKISNLNF